MPDNTRAMPSLSHLAGIGDTGDKNKEKNIPPQKIKLMIIEAEYRESVDGYVVKIVDIDGKRLTGVDTLVPDPSQPEKDGKPSYTLTKLPNIPDKFIASGKTIGKGLEAIAKDLIKNNI